MSRRDRWKRIFVSTFFNKFQLSFFSAYHTYSNNQTLQLRGKFLIHVSYYAVARLAHVAGLEMHIGSVFRKGFL